MAKCVVCNSKKGKRYCKAENAYICSLCCGQTRSFEKCSGCSFYEGSSIYRNYKKVPYFNTQQMSDSIELQEISNVVESILCSFDMESNDEFTDKIALNLLELAFDKYYFQDSVKSLNKSPLKAQLEQFIELIENDLPEISKEEILKVMASIYRSIQRRTNGNREYLDFVQQYVGTRVGTRARALSHNSLYSNK